jgi:acyl-CoA synthetase (NDP forming)
MSQVNKIFSQVKKEDRKALLEPEAKAICIEYGIPVTKFKVASNEKDAVKFADEIGYPVVFKIFLKEKIKKTTLK